MDQLLCKLCDPPRRHRLGEAHVFKGSEPEKPPKKIAAKVAACPERHGQPKPGIVVGYDFKAQAECPVCAERKRKKAAQMKRWRERKKA
jgi:hypothetical protein